MGSFVVECFNRGPLRQGRHVISKTLRQGDRVLDLLQEEYPGYHPLIGVAKIAHDTEDERLRFDCHKVLSEFVEPKLKSVEVLQTLPEDAKLHVIFEGDCEDVSIPDGTPTIAPPKPLPVDELLGLEASLDLKTIAI